MDTLGQLLEKIRLLLFQHLVKLHLDEPFRRVMEGGGVDDEKFFNTSALFLRFDPCKFLFIND